MSGVVAELDRTVQQAYQHERQRLVAEGLNDGVSLISIKDLDWNRPASNIGAATTATTTTKWQLLQSWHRMMAAYKAFDCFLDSAKSLMIAITYLHQVETTDYQHLKTLVDLLIHTLENRHRDPSTECRFVTLTEIMLSYIPNWKPSEQVLRFWVRIMQRIPVDATPVVFRRKAYRVLVSLSWVPSSQGLLAACSFDASKQQTNIDEAPEGIRRHLSKIRKRPLPRYDCVNQLLDRLKDETDVCVAISSRFEGTGKTTLAALVAAHASILRVFEVLWLPLDQFHHGNNGDGDDGESNDSQFSTKELTFAGYTKLLDELCEQLDIVLGWPECISRFEEPALHKLRERGCMEAARGMMADAMLERERNILLVLDDVRWPSQMEWFRFNERQSIIVTTTDPDMAGVDWTVDLDHMSEDEAIELFLNESNLSVTLADADRLSSTIELRSLVRLCQCHPLTVRSVARWYQLKSVTAGYVKGMEELLADFSTFGLDDGASPDGEITEVACPTSSPKFILEPLFNMLSPARIDGPGACMTFTHCLAAAAVVFPDPAPLDVVLLLWEELLRCEPHLIDEMKHDALKASHREHALFIAEGLIHLGILSITSSEDGPVIRFHHGLYREFALAMAKEMDLADTFEETVVQWHKCFVSVYFAQRIKKAADETIDANSWKYALERLPRHIFKAKLVGMAEQILGDGHFFTARLDCLGWDRTIDAHIHDCAQLQRALDNDEERSTESASIASSVFVKLAKMVEKSSRSTLGTSEETLMIEISRGYFKIGVVLAQLRYFDEAMRQLNNAQKLLPQSNELRVSILYGSAYVLLAIGEREKAMKKVKACRRLIDESAQDHPLYQQVLQLHSDIFVSLCEYTRAVELFTDMINNLSSDLVADDRIDFGVAAAKKAYVLHTMGRIGDAKTLLSDSVAYKEEIGEVSYSLATALHRLGDLCLEDRRISEAREKYESAMSVLTALKCVSNRFDHLILTGKLRYLRNDHDGCVEAVIHAKDVSVDSALTEPDMCAYNLRSIASMLDSIAERDLSLNVLSHALNMTANRPLSLERATVLLDLGNALIQRGEISDGLIYLEQALEVRVMKLGECSQVLTTLNVIGAVQQKLCRFDEAVKVFDKVQEVALRVSPDDVLLLVETTLSIGESQYSMGLTSYAENQFDDAFKRLRGAMPEGHIEYAKCHFRVGKALARSRVVSSDAESHLTEALKLFKKNYDVLASASVEHCLGVFCRKLRRYEDAQTYLANSLESRKSGNDSTLVAETLFELGNLYRLQAQPENASSVYQKAIEHAPTESNVAGSIWLALGHTALSSGKDKDAANFYQQARDSRLKQHGRSNVKTGNTLRSLGVAFYLLGRGEKAMIVLHEYVRICETVPSSMSKERSYAVDFDPTSYVLALLLLGDVHEAAGQQEQARSYWTTGKTSVRQIMNILLPCVSC